MRRSLFKFPDLSDIGNYIKYRAGKPIPMAQSENFCSDVTHVKTGSTVGNCKQTILHKLFALFALSVVHEKVRLMVMLFLSSSNVLHQL